jgi:hypothetical protein
MKGGKLVERKVPYYSACGKEEIEINTFDSWEEVELASSGYKKDKVKMAL